MPFFTYLVELIKRTRPNCRVLFQSCLAFPISSFSAYSTVAGLGWVVLWSCRALHRMDSGHVQSGWHKAENTIKITMLLPIHK